MTAAAVRSAAVRSAALCSAVGAGGLETEAFAAEVATSVAAPRPAAARKALIIPVILFIKLIPPRPGRHMSRMLDQTGRRRAIRSASRRWRAGTCLRKLDAARANLSK